MSAPRDPVWWVRDLTSHEPTAQGDLPLMSGWLQRLCRAAVRDLPAMGVGISVQSGNSGPVTLAASSEASVLVEELQFSLGEGPCIDAYESRCPVLVPDLSAQAATTWPGYASAAHDHGVRAVFAFPLQVGLARLGALDVYRDRPGSMSAETLRLASTFADAAMLALLETGSGSPDVADLVDQTEERFLQVYQAQGMVMVQLGVGAEDALARLRAYAFAHDRRLVEVACDVTARRLTMESDD
jgi:hypothetical protein